MRRKDRQVTEAEAVSILENGQYGFLSTVSGDNEPYGVPLNYCLLNGCIYFHCAAEGRKIENLQQNPRVAFGVVGKTEVLPEAYATRYESCLVQGVAAEVFGEEKQLALEGLVHKYSAAFVPDGLKYIEKFRERTRVFKISPTAVSGKARR